MQIVDAQIHVWGSGLPSHLAHRQGTAFLPEEAVALLEAGGVDAAGHARAALRVPAGAAAPVLGP